jgi:hypothetical protein
MSTLQWGRIDCVTLFVASTRYDSEFHLVACPCPPNSSVAASPPLDFFFDSRTRRRSRCQATHYPLLSPPGGDREATMSLHGAPIGRNGSVAYFVTVASIGLRASVDPVIGPPSKSYRCSCVCTSGALR